MSSLMTRETLVSPLRLPHSAGSLRIAVASPPAKQVKVRTAVVPIEKLDLTLSSRPWAFADHRRAEIDDHFATLRKTKPWLWNGRVLLLHDYAIVGATFRGDFLETDFASFIAWRDWGMPDVTVKDCVAMGAIRASDGGFLLGVMSAHTANAGKIYFPAGMIDIEDWNGATIDLESSMWRELEEETGLSRDGLTADSFWHTVLDGSCIAHIRILHARETSHALRERILANLRRQKHPELTDVHIVRESTDQHPMIQPVVMTFLKSVGIL